MFRKLILLAAACLSLALSCAWAQAQTVEVKDAWIRGTVAGQKATGAFMEITSKAPARLVSVSSPAGTAEIHGMKMENGVMKMFPVEAVELPAGRAAKLAPGGHHVMFFDLKQPLAAGDRVPLKLTIEFADKRRETVELAVEVRSLTGAGKHAH